MHAAHSAGLGAAGGRSEFVPLETADGSLTFVHPLHGQTFHSRSGAWQEARERYAAACRLAQRARDISRKDAGDPRGVALDSTSPTLDLLDVGTGLGWNLAAALAALEGTGVRLCATSLELDLSVIRALLDHLSDGRPAARDEQAERWHACVRAAFASALADPDAAASPSGVPLGSGSLRLCAGDARATLPALAPSSTFDAVFLDPFSPAVDEGLWQPEFLGEIARRMRPGAWLSTYTVSMTVRARLSAAGLRVGPGARVGTKSAGTVASPDQDPGALPPRSARRLARRVAAIRADGALQGLISRVPGELGSRNNLR